MVQYCRLNIIVNMKIDEPIKKSAKNKLTENIYYT